MFNPLKNILFVAVLLATTTIHCGQSEGERASSAPSDLRTRKTGQDWPTFRGPTGDGKSAENFPMAEFGESGPPVRWSLDVGEGYSAVAVSSGRLFLFHRLGNKERLTCLNSEPGSELWHFEYDTDYEDLYGFSNGPRSTPVVDGDRVYIHGVQGPLHCLNVVDGSVVWQTNTSTEYNVVKNFFGVGSTPVVEGKLLVVVVGGSPPNDLADVQAADGKVESNNTGIVAFNKLTGEVVYASLDQLASYASPVITTVDNRRLGFLFTREGLVGFAPETGKEEFFYPWRAKTLLSVNASDPVVAGDLVFVSESYRLGSSVIRARPGGYDVVWKDEKRSREKAAELHWNSAVHHDGFLYCSSGKNTNGSDIRCIEMTTGRVVWSHTTNERSSLIYVNEHFISIGENGTFTYFKAQSDSANIIASMRLKGKTGKNLNLKPAWSAPALSNGFLYVRGNNQLVCFDLMDTATNL